MSICTLVKASFFLPLRDNCNYLLVGEIPDGFARGSSRQDLHVTCSERAKGRGIYLLIGGNAYETDDEIEKLFDKYSSTYTEGRSIC